MDTLSSCSGLSRVQGRARVSTGLRRTESIKSRRKVSAVSDRSDTSERADVSGEESPGVLSDEPAPESPVDLLAADGEDAAAIAARMPWLKASAPSVRCGGEAPETSTHERPCCKMTVSCLCLDGRKLAWCLHHRRGI